MESQRRIIFLFVMISQAAEEVKVNLVTTVGGNITLPDPVLEFGFLLGGVKLLALVKKDELLILEDIFQDRILWNKSTGLFTITHLQRNNSGIYSIDSKKGKIFTSSYKVTVYDAVRPPEVKPSNVSSESCSLLCSADKAGGQTRLLWYKDDELVKQNSSALSLLVTLYKQDFSSSYRCVASNPADNKTALVDVKTSCRLNDTEDTSVQDRRHRLIPIIIPVVCGVCVILVACVIWNKYLGRTSRPKQDPVDGKTDAQSTDVHICADRHSQEGIVAETIDRANLTTVYDKLEVHRMVLTDPVEA